MDIKTNHALCDFVRRLRGEAGYGQSEVAEVLSVSRSAYSYKELGRTSFYPEELLLLAGEFGIEPDVFFEPKLWDRKLSDLRKMKFAAPEISHLGQLTAEEIEIIAEYRRGAAHD